MSHVIEVVLTDEEFDAVDAGVPGEDTADSRVRVYLQQQVDTIVLQHVQREEANRFRAAGLPAELARINLDADQKALILAAGKAKVAAAVKSADVVK